MAGSDTSVATTVNRSSRSAYAIQQHQCSWKYDFSAAARQYLCDSILALRRFKPTFRIDQDAGRTVRSFNLLNPVELAL